MARLPKVGDDSGKWGDILNDYLRQSHNDDGTLRNQTVSNSAVADATITLSKLSPEVVAALGTGALPNDSIEEVKLSLAVRGKLNAGIADASITREKLAPGSVSAGKLEDGAVTSGKIEDGAVTPAKARHFGSAGGFAALGSDGLVPDTQLPDRMSESAIDNRIRDGVAGQLDPGLLLVTPDRFGIDLGGESSANAAINAALGEALPGSTVKFSGRLRITAQINIPAGKNLTLDFGGATLVRDFSGTMLNCAATFESPFGVTLASETTENVSGTQTHTVSVLTLTSAPPWAAGDILRVVSDDTIPGENYNVGDTGHMRFGEFAHVYRVAGNTVYLSTTLRDAYATNIRAARVRRGSVHIRDLTADVSDAAWNAKTLGRTLRLTGTVGARVTGLTVLRELNYPVSLRATLATRIDAMFSHRLHNDPENGYYGYAIHEASSEDTVITALNSIDARHAWTDGVALTNANSSALWDYGRVQNSKLIGCTARATTQSAWDTHHGSRGIQFISCTAFTSGSKNGFALRGENHSVVNGRVVGAGRGIRVFTENVNGESRRHYVSNLRLEDVDTAIVVEVRSAPEHPNYNVRDTATSLVVSGLYAENIGALAYANNGKVRITNADVRLRPSLTAPAIFSRNSEVSITGLQLNALGVTAYSANNFIQSSSSNGLLRVEGAIDLSDTLATQLAGPGIWIADSTCDGLYLDVTLNRHVRADPAPVPASCDRFDVRWKVSHSIAGGGSRKKNGGSCEMTNGNIASTSAVAVIGIGSYPELLLSVTISDNTPRTLAPLPVGHFNGQQLLIHARDLGGAAVTIVSNAASSRTTLRDGNVVLNANGATLRLVWFDSVWYQA